jgi:thioredoxin:protein disulfide reductase
MFNISYARIRERTHYRILCIAIGIASLATVSSAQFGDNPFAVAVDIAQTAATDAASLSVAFTVPAGNILYAHSLEVSAKAVQLTPLAIPDPKLKDDPFGDEQVGVYDHDFEFVYALDESAAFPLLVSVSYQGCNETLCFMPQTETFQVVGTGDAAQEAPLPGDAVIVDDALLAGFEITGHDSGFKKSPEFIAFLDRVEAGEGVAENPLSTMVANQGIWVLVLAILLGGLALNLTPCVLPMIPVNIAIIGAGSQAGSRSRGFGLGATYGLGIAMVYGVLGAVVVLTGSQFGALNASPWFNMAIAALFLVLSLAMFGVFNIDFSRFQSGGGSKQASRGPFITAFIFGGVAALLAGACVAPVLIWVLVLSTEIYQRGTTAGLLLPFLLGLGMALPWPFAGAGLSFLPKPGQWMERIKIGFGVVILAAAVYYGHQGVRLLAPAAETKSDVEVTTDLAWLTSLDEALAQSRTSGKPVFVDVWATWCKSCKAMSKTTLKDPDVLSRLSSYVPLKFQAEEPKDPDTKRVLDALGVKGQPFYVILQPQ